ncbi:hypothetical protein BDP27DRAFT_1362206 [Rhodocollybia butyracea]|uniref:DUF4470 domain-containing protein n=1 Tax=Rhodocollybia butyracea TaxID=206335 RepID=A0A9P5PZP4_9AGAR|nr:hypothetical protein BDP27DRAFT_1362206 [Rhodocollybia butyracea]
MLQPLHWLGKYFFYAIGNTPATSLTRDLSTGTPANILLLGCGDPRDVLFSIFNEDKRSNRRLDITCSDIDPAIIVHDITARNILLVTMIIDNKTALPTVWKLFYDMKIDRDSYSKLIDHCKMLWEYSSTQKAWVDSPYGPTIKFSTLHTLEQVRQHWKLYIEMENLPLNKQQSIREAFTKLLNAASQKFSEHPNISPARAAGPLMPEASSIYGQHSLHYSSTGVSSTESTSLTSATMINPTFAYSFVGEGCNVHYGTSPLTPFHTSALFANATRPLHTSDVLQAAQKHFGEWCDSYRSRAAHPSKIVLRFLVGEATAVCGAFQSLNTTHCVHTLIPVSQWRTDMLTFDESQYSIPNDASAPTHFDVITTSNLIDHVGLLNILVAALPLRNSNGVIYTESLLYRGKRKDAAKEFGAQLFADLGMMTLLLGVAPVDYLSGFSSQSNAHETLVNTFGGQLRQVTTWKAPTSSDLSVNARPAVVFGNLQLGTLLWNVYHQMFEDENPLTVLKKYHHFDNIGAISSSNKIMYNRESFVLFLKLIRGNLALLAKDWEAVMKTFLDLQGSDGTLLTDTAHRQDFYLSLYRHNVYTFPFYQKPLPQTGRFTEWSLVPHLVRVVLTVPRSTLDNAFNDPAVATPVLRCEVRGMLSVHVFSSVHAVFGRVSSTGTKSSPQISLKEDKEGWEGKSPLVVSFTIPTRLLVEFEPQGNLSINLAIASTVCTIAGFAPKLGTSLNVYSAMLSDGNHIKVLPEPISHAAFPTPALSTESLPHKIGSCGPVMVSLDDKHETVHLFSCRMNIEDPETVQSFGTEGVTPNVKQVSPCAVRLTVSSTSQNFIFPYPVQGSDYRLRLARKSLYIELLVPPSGPFQSGGMRTRPFPVTLPDSSSRYPDIQVWNIHHVNLSRLPVLDCSRPKALSEWFNTHIELMMSTREHEFWNNIKEPLRQIMVEATGVHGGKARRLFSLKDRATCTVDTILFISDLRFDQSAYTVVCDGFVLPLTDELIANSNGLLAGLINGEDVVQIWLGEGGVASWKHLIPAFVERCRSSWIHTASCKYKAQGSIPLTDNIKQSPLCSCGQSKDVEGMLNNPSWRPFAPHTTRIALSPLFAGTYLDPII